MIYIYIINQINGFLFSVILTNIYRYLVVFPSVQMADLTLTIFPYMNLFFVLIF